MTRLLQRQPKEMRQEKRQEGIPSVVMFGHGVGGEAPHPIPNFAISAAHSRDPLVTPPPPSFARLWRTALVTLS